MSGTKTIYIDITNSVGTLFFEGEMEVEFDVEPAQYGGRTDPSWDAYAEVTEVNYLDVKVFDAITSKRCDYELTESDKELIEAQIDKDELLEKEDI